MNYVTILIAAVVQMAIGFAWYSPMFFGKEWMKLMGYSEKSMEEAKKKMGQIYGVAFVGALVMAYVLAQLIDMTGAATVQEGMQLAFWAWFGFIAPVMLTDVLFGGKPMKLYFINVTYQLAGMLAMGALLAAWAQ